MKLFYHLRIFSSRDGADIDEDYEQAVGADGIYETVLMGIFEVSEAMELPVTWTEDRQTVVTFTFEYNDDMNLYSFFPTMAIYLYNR